MNYTRGLRSSHFLFFAYATLSFVEFVNAQIVIEPDVLAFDVVQPCVSHTKTIRLTNKGGKQIELLSAEVECKACTLIDFRPTRLSAGERASIAVTFKPPQNESGDVARKIKIITSDPAERNITLKIEANVTETAGLWPSKLLVEEQTVGSNYHCEIKLVNVSKETLRTLYATGFRGGPRLMLPKEGVPPGESATIGVDWEFPTKPGDYSGSVVLYVEHPNLSKLVLPCNVHVTPVKDQGSATTQNVTK